MSFLSIKILEINPDFDDSLNAVNGLISPIPRNNWLEDGYKIYEEHPSMGWARMPDGTEVFKDLTDEPGKGYDELKFIKELEKVSLQQAKDIQNNYRVAETLQEPGGIAYNWDAKHKQQRTNGVLQNIASAYGFNFNVLKELKICKVGNEEFTTPVINNGEILALVHYQPNDPLTKIKRTSGTKGSLIVGFDSWLEDSRPTLICEGEKDMIMARTMGYNAITLTGGARSLPDLYPTHFQNKEVYIAYDNDEAGKQGARKLAVWLKEHNVKLVKVVEGHHELLPDKGDIYDYFTNLKKTKADFDKIIEDTEEFSKTHYETEVNKLFKYVSLLDAMNEDNHNKLLQTNIQVVAEYSNKFLVPELVEIKAQEKSKSGGMQIPIDYTFSVSNPRDFLRLMENEDRQHSTIVKNSVSANNKPFPPKAEILSFKKRSEETIFAVDVEPAVNDWDNNENLCENLTIQAYCIRNRPQVGKKYRIRFKVTSHPNEKSRIVMLIEDFVPLEQFTQTFELSNEMKTNLQCFQPKTGETVVQAMDRQYEQMKGYIGSKLQKDVWLANDLVFNSALKMMYRGRPIRATLDAAIIADAGYGKTYTFTFLQKLYKMGTKISGENATPISIIGGSTTKGNQGYKTTVGVLGQNDKGMVFFEEFATLADDLMGQLNEVRSEGRARVSRIDGSLNYSAELRYLFVGNQKEAVQQMSFNKSGMEPIKTYFRKPEQRRRFDFILATGNKEAFNDEAFDIDFGAVPAVIYPEEWYEQRIKWIWSRSPEQIFIDVSTWQQATTLVNDWWTNYWTKEPLFGVDKEQTLLKLARIAIACAGMLYSTSDGVVLTVEYAHFEWAYEHFFKPIYDNPIFKIKEFATEIQFTTKPTAESIALLQTYYDNNKVFIDELSKVVESVNTTVLKVLFGSEDKDKFYKVINDFIKAGFILSKKDMYEPSIKFKASYQAIDKSVTVKTLEEEKLEQKPQEQGDSLWS